MSEMKCYNENNIKYSNTPIFRLYLPTIAVITSQGQALF